METGPVVMPPYVAGPLRLDPFRAWMLSPGRVGDPGIARMITRRSSGARARWSQWVDRGVLTRDRGTALHIHEYTSGGITVRGLVGALDVSRRAATVAQRAVFPHEGIHPAQADDLADRMEALHVNPAPILLVHRATPTLHDLLGEIRSGRPERSFTDQLEQQHRLWAIREPTVQSAINVELVHAAALIADGHHRYAAYLRLQQRRPGGAEDRGLAMLVDQGDTPLFLGAIHRVLEGVGLADLSAAARLTHTTVRTLSREQALDSLGPTTMVATDGTDWVAYDVGDCLNRAVVEVLHDDLVPLLPRGPARVVYVHEARAALERAQRRRVAVLLPAASFDSVMSIVSRDRLLPEKATSFQPKPSMGVLIRSLRDG